MIVSEPCLFQRLCPADTELVNVLKGRAIFMRGQEVRYVYHLHNGITAGSNVSKLGHEMTDMTIPPYFIGVLGFMDMYTKEYRTHLADCRALTPAVYCKVRREAVWELMDDRTARAEILQLICESMTTKIAIGPVPAKTDVANRILHILQMLTRAIGAAPTGEQIVISEICHEEIAMLANTTRPTVTRLFDYLQKSGFIEVKRRQLIIKDPAGLGRLDYSNYRERIGHSKR